MTENSNGSEWLVSRTDGGEPASKGRAHGVKKQAAKIPRPGYGRLG